MATEIATLKFKADTSDLARAERMLQRLGAASREAANDYEYLTDEQEDQEEQQRRNNRENEKGRKGLNNLAKAARGAAAAIGLIAGAQKTLEVAREFDVINASLITMTGSTENAARAFTQIQQFAATTPFDLQQVSNAFVKLQALGLDPSERALRSYGNTASAMGKDLMQFIEAVADASTMQFERLLDFGIKARQESESVSLTFRGKTTTIGKSAEEIQAFLLAIGETDFSSAMSERAATLDGAFSNLGDTVDQFFLSLTRGETGGLINDVTRAITASIQDLADSINLLNGTAGLDLQLEASNEELLRLQQQLALTPEIFVDQRKEILDKIAAEEERQRGIVKQIHDEAEAVSAQQEADRLAREEAAAEESARIEAAKQAKLDEARQKAEAAEAKRQEKQRERDKAAAQANAEQMARLDDDALAQSRNREADRLAQIKADLAAKLITEQEFQDAKTAIERAGEEERAQIRRDMAEAERERIHQENEAAYQAEEDQRAIEALDQETRDAEEAERRKAQREGLAAIEDQFLKGRSEKEKAAYRVTTGLMDQEKRDRAKEIVSKSYSAAMGAYESLASIPIVGPALGAAAAAAILAQGVQMAAQSLSGRALGGQVRAGESYVVGERGPEVLTMGSMAGKITPNEALRGNQQPQMVSRTANVNFAIQANDTRGFDELLVERRSLIISVINDALNDSGRTSLV